MLPDQLVSAVTVPYNWTKVLMETAAVRHVSYMRQLGFSTRSICNDHHCTELNVNSYASHVISCCTHRVQVLTRPLVC